MLNLEPMATVEIYSFIGLNVRMPKLTFLVVYSYSCFAIWAPNLLQEGLTSLIWTLRTKCY